MGEDESEEDGMTRRYRPHRRLIDAEARETIRRLWKSTAQDDIATQINSSPRTVRKYAGMMGLGPGFRLPHPGKHDKGWPALTADPWPAKARFADIPNPDRDRFPSLGYRPYRRSADYVSPGNGTRLCAEMA
jgi:hypothetical protein